MKEPLVSVIIPCREEAASVARCLNSVLASQAPECAGEGGAELPPEPWMEVIVADGMSGEETRAILTRYADWDARVRVIENQERITPAALNYAIRVARGKYIQRVDAHSVLETDYIAKAVETLESTEAWGVGGAMRTSADLSQRFGLAIQTALGHRFGVGNSGFRTATGVREEIPREVDAVFNACWRRTMFDEIGGFDTRLARSQDIEMSSRIRRAGGRLLLDPAMDTTYFSKSTLPAFLQQNWNNGVWALLPFAYLDRVPLRPRHLAPLAFVAGCFAMVTGAVLGWLPAWGTIVLLWIYGAINLLATIQCAARERSPKLLWQMPLVFAGLHLGYGTGSLWGAIRAMGLRLAGSRASRGSVAIDPARNQTNSQPSLQTRSKGVSV